MTNAIHAALSGLIARQTQVDAAARNVANATTPGYKRLEAALEETPGGVRARVERVEDPGPVAAGPGGAPVELSNVDLTREIPGLLVGQRGFETNLKVLQAQDEMLGALLDLRR